MSESKDLAKQIVTFLNGEGWHVRENNSGKIQKGSRWIYMSPAGEADVTGRTGDGRYVHVEVKIPPDTLSDEQIEELRQVTKSTYGIACVATSWKQFQAWYFEGESKGFYRSQA